MKCLKRLLRFLDGGGWYDDHCTCAYMRHGRLRDPNCAVHRLADRRNATGDPEQDPGERSR